MATIDSVKLPDNSTYDLTDNYSGYQKETLTTPLTINGTQETTVEGALGGLNDYGDALADNLAANENVYGAKNLNSYPYYETTKNQNGITFTDNGDGTVKVGDSTAQTATDYVFFYMHDRNNEDFILPDGDYKINGCPAGGVLNTTYQLIIAYKDSNNITVEAVDVGDGATIHIENSLQGKDKTKVTFAIIVFGNYTVPAGGITFKPMIRDARILDPNYAPPAKTNKQLTDDKAERKDLTTIFATGNTNNSGAQIAAGKFFYLNGVYCKALTDIASDATFTANTNYKTTSINEELAGGTWQSLTSSLTNEQIWAKKVGDVCSIRFSTFQTVSISAGTWTNIATVPDNMKPSEERRISAIIGLNGNLAWISITSAGVIRVYPFTAVSSDIFIETITYIR